jgi:hypothetical protein
MERYAQVFMSHPLPALVAIMGLAVDVFTIYYWRRYPDYISIWYKVIGLFIGLAAIYVGIGNIVLRLSAIKP